jgi:hypothetical protein
MDRSTAVQALLGHEIEYNRLARVAGLGSHERQRQHADFALRRNYEPLMAAAVGVDAAAVRRIAEQLLSAGDPRDVLAARDSLLRLLGLSPIAG